MDINIEFSGGAELLFGNKKQHHVTLPSDPSQLWTIKNLIVWITDNLLEERAELFSKDGTVRPGILVLVNDVDWELMGELEYKVCKDDTITFISTLHGG